MAVLKSILQEQYDYLEQNTDAPGFVSSFQRGLGQSVQGVGQVAEDLGWEDNFIKRYGEDVVRTNPSGINSLEDIADNPWLAFKEATGNAASFLLPGGAIGRAGKVAGLGRGAMFAAQTANAAMPSYAGIREQQIAQGFDSPTDMLIAAGGAAAVGAIENLFGAQRIPIIAKALGLPAETTTRELVGKFGESYIKSAGKAIFGSTVGEGLEEMAQNPIEQMAAYRDPTTGEAIDETLFGGAMGALGGFGLGGIGGFQAYQQHKGMAQGLQREGFIEEGRNTPTDLLRGLDIKDQLEYNNQATGSYDEYRQLQDLYTSGLEEAAGLQQREQQMATADATNFAQQQAPYHAQLDPMHEQLAMQDRVREMRMPQGYGVIDDLREVNPVVPTNAVDMPAPRVPKVKAVTVAKQNVPAEKQVGKRQQEIESLVAEARTLVPEDQIGTILNQAKNNKLGDLRTSLVQLRKAAAESPAVQVETPEQAVQRKAALHEVITEEGRKAAVTELQNRLTAKQREAITHYMGSSSLDADKLMEVRGRLMQQHKQMFPEATEQEAAKAVDAEVANWLKEESETGGGSMSYVGAQMGIGKPTAQKHINKALAAVEAFAFENELRESDLYEALGWDKNSVQSYLDTVSPEEAAQAGLRFRGKTKQYTGDYAGSANDDFNATAGYTRDETTSAEKTGTVEEESVEDAVDVVDVAAETSDQISEAGSPDYDENGIVVTSGDVNFAINFWKRAGGPELTPPQAKELAQILRAQRSGVINDRQIREQLQDFQHRVVPNVAETGAPQKDAGNAAGGDRVRRPAVAKTAERTEEKPATKVVAKKTKVDKAALKIAAQWDAYQAAEGLNTPWAKLSDDQRSLIAESPNAREEAVAEVARQLKKGNIKSESLTNEGTGIADEFTRQMAEDAHNRTLDNNGLREVLAPMDGAVRISSYAEVSGAELVPNAEGGYDTEISQTETDPAQVQHHVRHEIAHRLDGGQAWIHSDNPVMELQFNSSNQPIAAPKAKVMRELLNLYRTNPFFKHLLSYPLHRSFLEEYDYDALWVQSEVFAQVGSLYLGEGRSILESEAPLTAAYMKEVIEYAKANPDEYQVIRQVNARENGKGEADGGQKNQRSESVSGGLRASNGNPQKVTTGGSASLADEETATQTAIRESLTTAKDIANKLLHKVVFMHDLVRIAVKEGLKSAEGFNELMGQKDQIQNRLEERVDRIMERAAQLKDKAAVEQFLRDSTLDKKWGYDDNPQKAKADPALKARFDRLSPEAQKVVKDIFQTGEDNYNKMVELAQKEVNREYDGLAARAKTPEKKAEIEAERRKELKRQSRVLPKLQGPYAPLMRFGNHVVVAKSKEYLAAEAANDDKAMQQLINDRTKQHYVVEFFPSAGKAETRELELKRTMPSVVRSNKQEVYSKVDELPWAGVHKLKEQIQNDPEAQGKFKLQQLVTNLYLEMLAESSARKHQMTRKGTEGAGDMLRAFAAHGRKNAHFLSSMEKSGEISRQMTAMRTEAHDNSDGKRDAKTRVYNEIAARYAQGLDYRDTPLADKAMRATSLWMLLTSPAYYLTNATQPWMVTMPVLGGKYGSAGVSALYKAYGDVAKFVGKMGHELDINKLPISNAEKKMLTDLRDSGKLDITIASDLGRWAEGSVDQGPVARTLQKLNGAVAKVEALNRITTALAAYRLSNGDSKYAGEIVDLTQGNYAGNNAPRFFAANAATKVMTQFRKYQLIQLSLIGRLLHDSYAGASVEEKAAARKAFLWMFAQQAVFTGVKGLPIPAVLYMLAAALGGDDDKDWERNLRKWVGDDETAVLLTRGLPAWLGVDLSGRIGMGSAFSILPFSDVDFSKKGYKEAVFGASGAFIGGMGGNVFDGIDKIQNGKYYQGIEAMMPKGVKDMMAGYRLANKGIEDSRGGTLLSADEISFFNGFMKAAGLPTTNMTEFQNKRGDMIELSKHFDEREARLKSSYADKDMTLGEASKEWKDIQDSKKRWMEEMKQRGVVNKRVLDQLKPSPLSTLIKYPKERGNREYAKA